MLTGCAPGALPTESPTTTTSADAAKADAVMRIVRDAMAQAHLKAVIVRVTVDGKEVVTQAVGESMTGVPANTAMHFRNGAVAISYVATLLLKLVDEKKVSLDDKLSKWLPEIPHADRVTLGQLAQMTSGYVDYVIGNTAMNDELYANPFRRWTVHDILSYATSQPLLYEPGTNWNYAHTNYVLLGLALEKATGQEMSKLLSDKVLRPLGLTNTANSLTPEIPSPVLHAFTSERRDVPQDPSGHTVLRGIHVLGPVLDHHPRRDPDHQHLRHGGHRGRHRIRAPAHRRLLQEDGVHRSSRQDPQTAGLHHLRRDERHLHLRARDRHLGQLAPAEPLMSGYAAVEAYLPSQKIAIAVAATYAPEAFDDQGNYRNDADTLFRRIGDELAPDDAPPLPPPK